MTPREFLALVIGRWEGGYQSYADDLGNWVTAPDGTRVKIGTMRGVTPAALALHRGVEAWTLTPADMQSVTPSEAVEIGFDHYYQQPHFDLLSWGPATAAVLDFAWSSGPGQAALSVQRLIGAGADGIVGDNTAFAYNSWVQRLGWDGATEAVHDMRAAFYRHIVEVNPANAKFLTGWLNRDDWASAANDDWRKAWEAAA